LEMLGKKIPSLLIKKTPQESPRFTSQPGGRAPKKKAAENGGGATLLTGGGLHWGDQGDERATEEKN